MQLAPVFSSGAVFQRNREIRVFGEGKGRFSASFLGEERSVEADGSFCVTFSAHEAGGPYEMTVDLDGEKKTLSDLMIGDVFLIAGQSNAELPIQLTGDRDTVFPADDRIRMYTVPRPDMDEQGNLCPTVLPYNECWMKLKPENAPEWTAIGLHIARHYAAERQIPIGVLACFKGASSIRAFLGEEAVASFELEEDKLHPDHRTFPWNGPAYLRNTMFKTVMPYAVSSMVWYQGESNRTLYEAAVYDQMLIEWIREWRRDWLAEKTPVVVVQINDFPEDCEPGVHGIQQAQERAVRQISCCALVRIADLGEHENIHPERKDLVAKRICTALDGLLTDQ